jgi:mannosyltransferase OCH1-like enzyme
MIPRILHRTVPAAVDPVVEGYWDGLARLHPGWEMRTWRDPLDRADFPLTHAAWDRCGSGAQRAGLIRLEVLWTIGGVYVDSDVEGVRSLDPLLVLDGFSAWEQPGITPDAVLGAVPAHPAIWLCLEMALTNLERGAWHSGPGVTTAILPGRPDWSVLPQEAFYPYYFTEPERRGEDFSQLPGCYLVHHWAGSWLNH